jgi:hypothetical protein
VYVALAKYSEPVVGCPDPVALQIEATTIGIETDFSGAHLLMKIDVEGREGKALLGMKRTNMSESELGI